MQHRDVDDTPPYGMTPPSHVDGVRFIDGPSDPADVTTAGFYPHAQRPFMAPQVEQRRGSMFDGLSGQVLFAVMCAVGAGLAGAVVSTAYVASVPGHERIELYSCAFFTFFGFGFVGFVAGFMFHGARGLMRAGRAFKEARQEETYRRELAHAAPYDSYALPPSYVGVGGEYDYDEYGYDADGVYRPYDDTVNGYDAEGRYGG